MSLCPGTMYIGNISYKEHKLWLIYLCIFFPKGKIVKNIFCLIISFPRDYDSTLDDMAFCFPTLNTLLCVCV